MRAAYDPEAVQPLPYHNLVEEAVGTHFGDPSLWVPCDLPELRLENSSLAGLRQHDFTPDMQFSFGDDPDSVQQWVSLLYGLRVTNKPSIYGGGLATFEKASLETMCDIHKHLATTLLAEEQARPSTFARPPYPEQYHKGPNQHDRIRANNLFWLDCLTEENIWPIMITVNGGREAPLSHDYVATHSAVSLLLPQNAQKLITRVGRAERRWLAQHPDPKERMIHLPNDPPQDPFGFMYKKDYRDGMDIIDSVTESSGYIQLLHYLMHGPGNTPEERLQTLVTDVWKHSDNYRSPLYSPYQGLMHMQAYMGVMQNFVTRHRRGRDATPEEVHAVCAEFHEGVIRVAKSLIEMPVVI
ncbi:MAG TPA: hypothetical protein VLG92_04665 [Candidatus Saccharimonadia bacterium]|nr:hypothetical protein [Candidatus Saccharimonadia bacterium]